MAGFKEKSTAIEGEAPHYLGHRERLKQRFRDTGGESFEDYELLELVLFQVVPRADTKPLAKALLKRFGSFEGVLGADEHLLREVPGAGDAIVHHFKVLLAVAQRFQHDRAHQGALLSEDGRTPLDTWSAVLDYCRAAMAHEPIEQFRVLFLNKKNELIDDEVMHRGTVDHAPAYPREIVKRALELSATALVLAHNHPSGDPTPSRADIEMTRQIVEIAKPLGIVVHDHIIIGRNGTASLRALKLM